jgi:hypothetical protein
LRTSRASPYVGFAGTVRFSARPAAFPNPPMNWLRKIWFDIRELFLPGAAAYNERRQKRILILCVIVGVLVAVAVGVMLYYNGTKEFRR